MMLEKETALNKVSRNVSGYLCKGPNITESPELLRKKFSYTLTFYMKHFSENAVKYNSIVSNNTRWTNMILLVRICKTLQISYFLKDVCCIFAGSFYLFYSNYKHQGF